jgi:hypothetical protein
VVIIAPSFYPSPVNVTFILSSSVREYFLTKLNESNVCKLNISISCPDDEASNTLVTYLFLRRDPDAVPT